MNNVTNLNIIDPLYTQSIDSYSNQLNIGIQSKNINIGGPNGAQVYIELCLYVTIIISNTRVEVLLDASLEINLISTAFAKRSGIGFIPNPRLRINDVNGGKGRLIRLINKANVDIIGIIVETPFFIIEFLPRDLIFS